LQSGGDNTARKREGRNGCSAQIRDLPLKYNHSQHKSNPQMVTEQPSNYMDRISQIFNFQSSIPR
jgi:hypothetical protein